MTQLLAPRRAAFAAGLAGLIAAPAVAQSAGRPPARPAPGRGPDVVQGFSRERLARIGPAMAAEAARGSFPGCVALIARNGEIVHHAAYGHLDAARTKPMSRDAIFLQASMTKPMTSAAAMMLVEEGRVKLGDPITNWLPELRDLKVESRAEGREPEDVAPGRMITVQDLLRHTSGLIYANASPTPRIGRLYDEGNIEAREGPITGDEMLRRLGAIPLAHQPGTTFHYSISTDVLGLLVERVEGRRLDAVFRDRLTGPLGMRDTTWFVEPARLPRLAESPTTDPQTEPMRRAYRITEDQAGRSYLRGGAGLVSTAADYGRFAQMIADGGRSGSRRFLAEPVVGYMLSDHTVGLAGSPAASTGPGYGFGLGFAVRRQDGVAVAPGSTGDAMWAGAWGTSFTIDRAEGLVAVLMAQGPSARGQTRMLFKNLVYGAMVDSQRR